MIQMADDKLYKSKQNGRNQVCMVEENNMTP